MPRLQRNAWRELLTIAVLIGVVGVWPLLVGIAEDPSVPLGLTELSLSELAAESPDGFRLADFIARGSGLGLIVNGALRGDRRVRLPAAGAMGLVGDVGLAGLVPHRRWTRSRQRRVAG